jgi:tRNA(fMet)-specific endonuclease VapC
LIYLLDTNAVSAIFRGRPETIRIRFANAVSGDNRIVLSVIVLHELYFGALRSAKPASNKVKLQQFADEMDEVVDLTAEDARIAGDIRATLAPQGKLIGPYDLLIAAQALRMQATLVTANVREFARVPGLVWEDWSQSSRT